MRPVRPDLFWAARRIYLHSSFAKLEVFLFLKIFRPRTGLSTKHRSVNLYSRNTLERSVKVKKISLSLAFAGMLFVPKSPAVSLDDIQFWTGSGTNRAALVVEWSTPELLAGTSVPAPITDKSLVWGYRFNGTITGVQMFNAIVAVDPRLYTVETIYSFGTSVSAIGFHLGGGGDLGITDGSVTNFFTNGLLTNATFDLDVGAPLNPGDIYWGDLWGPNLELWTEQGDVGGFFNCPDRGTNPYWTSTDPSYASSGFHGQWDLAQNGLSGLTLTNGSWIGFSVASATPDYINFDPNAPYGAHKHAPAEPDTDITALVKNFGGRFQFGQWRAQFVSCTNWSYSLERSPDLKSWTTVTNGIPGNNTNLLIADPAPAVDKLFYRIRADQP